MTWNTTPVWEKEPYSKASTFTNSSTANALQDLVPDSDIPPEGIRLDQISITSTETANPRVVQFWDHDGSTAYLIDSVNVPVLSGSDGTTPKVDALATLAPGLVYLQVPDGHNLKISITTQPASGKTITVSVRGGKLAA